ncbi:hypothetical protein ABPG72_005816, partial [Tetrahymena utriculariae]
GLLSNICSSSLIFKHTLPPFFNIFKTFQYKLCKIILKHHLTNMAPRAHLQSQGLSEKQQLGIQDSLNQSLLINILRVITEIDIDNNKIINKFYVAPIILTNLNF